MLKLEIIVIIQGNIEVLHIAYVFWNKVCPKKNPVAFHNRSNYDYQFIIKELAVEFKNKFICLRENTEKYITFKVPIENEVTIIDNNGEKIYVTYYNLLIVQDF